MHSHLVIDMFCTINHLLLVRIRGANRNISQVSSAFKRRREPSKVGSKTDGAVIGAPAATNSLARKTLVRPTEREVATLRTCLCDSQPGRGKSWTFGGEAIMRDVSVSVLTLLSLAVAQIMGIQTHQDGMTSARNVHDLQPGHVLMTA